MNVEWWGGSQARLLPTTSRRSQSVLPGELVLLGRRPCGRLLPTASRRSQPPAEYKSALLGGIVLFGETPMRASPAEYNSALRLGGAPGLVEGDGVGGGVGGAVVVGYG